MPLAAPIGSGLGIQNASNLRILRERITEVPLIVDAGVGTASDAAEAMELGADAILMNTAIAEAQDAVLMAEAMRDATAAGRKGTLPPHAQAPLRRRLQPLSGVRALILAALYPLLTLRQHDRLQSANRCTLHLSARKIRPHR